MNRKLIAILMAATLVIGVLTPYESQAAKAKNTLNKKSVSLVEGKTFTLKVNNKTKGATVSYKMAKKTTVAKVSSKGKITALKKGSAQVTVTVKKAKKTLKTLKCKVVVTAKSTTEKTPAPGTPAPGTPAPETLAPGTPVPGTPAPETPAPGTPTPETPTPEIEYKLKSAEQTGAYTIVVKTTDGDVLPSNTTAVVTVDGIQQTATVKVVGNTVNMIMENAIEDGYYDITVTINSISVLTESIIGESEFFAGGKFISSKVVLDETGKRAVVSACFINQFGEVMKNIDASKLVGSASNAIASVDMNKDTGEIEITLVWAKPTKVVSFVNVSVAYNDETGFSRSLRISNKVAPMKIEGVANISTSVVKGNSIEIGLDDLTVRDTGEKVMNNFSDYIGTENGDFRIRVVPDGGTADTFTIVNDVIEKETDKLVFKATGNTGAKQSFKLQLQVQAGGWVTLSDLQTPDSEIDLAVEFSIADITAGSLQANASSVGFKVSNQSSILISVMVIDMNDDIITLDADAYSAVLSGDNAGMLQIVNGVLSIKDGKTEDDITGNGGATLTISYENETPITISITIE